MTITKTTKMKDEYSIECQKCNKKIRGVSVKAVRHNYKLHRIFCQEASKGQKEVSEQ